MERGLYEEDLEMFRELAVEFNSPEVAPHCNILSPGTTWPHACSRSSAVPVRSCAESSAGIAN
ncbi:hypothetical protein SAMN04489742_3902 [Arthrobacter crystallopoietes]|uniref:Uncharacterized protein n=1 Tax=Crystallibacter crystallopoietes TaxID=37928 RepID=A0A1H1G7X6_9MICC|nr:hypothetical protein SAMN04489742_3902 [Arthrobacter crystallopoietes]